MELVEWSDKYSVGISEIDEQHKKLLDIANQLFAACVQGKDAAQMEFRRIVKEAVKYVQTHFSFEEELMKRAGYPAYAEHKAEHAAFVAKVLEGVRDFEGGKPFVPNNFARFLRDWTLEHIAITDKQYENHLKAYLGQK